jgi:predicted phosphohydrolase
MLKLRYFSDLHLEFIKPTHLEKWMRQIPAGMDEVCILAGDIGNPYKPNYDVFMEFISKNFMKSFVIAGNHEYYYNHLYETNDHMARYFQKFENISFLNNRCEMYKGHCFIGTTLWSKITNPKYVINDMYSIPHFDIIHCNRLNRLCVDFLEDAIEKNENCVVITHHMPSSSLIDVKYLSSEMRPYNQWFYSDMDYLFEKYYDQDKVKNKIKGWFYGHTHTPSNQVIKGIPLLCNPIGYPNENKELDFQATFTLPKIED